VGMWLRYVDIFNTRWYYYAAYSTSCENLSASPLLPADSSLDTQAISQCAFTWSPLTNAHRSSVSDILGTDTTPTTCQIDAIQSTLREAQLDLTDVDVKIASVQSVLDKLSTHRQKLKSYVKRHIALLSPCLTTACGTMERDFPALLARRPIAPDGWDVRPHDIAAGM
jgi:hypothetical protein